MTFLWTDSSKTHNIFKKSFQFNADCSDNQDHFPLVTLACFPPGGKRKQAFCKKGTKASHLSLVCSKSMQETTAHLAGIYHFTEQLE